MRCPACGVALALALAGAPEPPPADPLDEAVRRLEAERYAPPVPEYRNHTEGHVE